MITLGICLFLLLRLVIVDYLFELFELFYFIFCFIQNKILIIFLIFFYFWKSFWFIYLFLIEETI